MNEAAETLEAILGRIPYARFLGLRAELAGDEMTAIMPFAEHLIGNPLLPALHGGVTGAFMELTAMAQLAIVERRPRLPRPIGVTVQYLRSGRPLTTYARAQIKKAGRRIANVHVEAWQETRAAPIASLHAHFLLSQIEEN
ncbi:PaaI family thioesterase [Caulobacter sp. 17J80-11]|uniref:PaaI family thioesterase n=1 Tax=Caulobacter sp. 17J80-11 TaxID=2763502 RepID=UPI00351C7587